MLNKKHFITFITIVLILISAACQDKEKTIQPPVELHGVLISEILAGVKGNNNYEFIELYNPGEEIIDIKGWTMWYRLPTSAEDLLVYRWKKQALIPPHGHYLLVREGERVGISPDATFQQALNTFGGGLTLKDKDGNSVDSLGWGKAPKHPTELEPAPALENDVSLERLPGGDLGNHTDSDNNSEDFILNTVPNMQNSGSSETPSFEAGLSIILSAPGVVEPGGSFEYSLKVSNDTDNTVDNIRVIFPIPEGLETSELSDEMEIENNTLTWLLGELKAGETRSAIIPINVPWTYMNAVATNYYVQSDDIPTVDFGGPVFTQIEGGVIPIGTARNLMDAELILEGTATMYTGGYFAGGGNTKFYLEDDTGGIQVQVFGGEGEVNVPIGAGVRVRGKIGAYRGAAQIVPILVPDDVEITTSASDGSPPSPTRVSIQQAAVDMETLPGELIQVEGTVTRLEEFTYSYEVDLTDDNGNTLTLYIDKLTNLIVESIEEGQLYTTSGILEVRDGSTQLYPRISSDLTQVFPPVLMITGDAPNNINIDDVFTTTLTIYNHTPETLTDIEILSPLPEKNAEFISAFDGGALTGNKISWSIPELSGNGTSLALTYTLRALSSQGDFPQIVSEAYTVTAAEWEEPASGDPIRSFIGSSVPVWAIQGQGLRSPYILDTVTTKGVVTGIFPGLNGFWIQETIQDNDPKTSHAIYVFSGDNEISLEPGNFVEITGQVREMSQQTTLQINSMDDMQTIQISANLPDPVELDPPDTTSEANAYYEAIEGMLVQISEPALATSPTSKYGECVIVRESHSVDRFWQGEDNGLMIMVDDGESTTHLDRSTMNYSVSTGDRVNNVLGPLAYTYGRYKVEPVEIPTISHTKSELPAFPPTSAGEFSIMTWNVENLFDIRMPHPDDPPIPRLAEYETDLTKVANTIVSAGIPTIVALQEVENIGILEDLAGHELLSEYSYKPFLIEGTSSRLIDNGYLVRSDQAEVIEEEQFSAPEGLTSRPPLMLKVHIQTTLGDATIFTLNNHFTSMSGGVEASEPVRNAQAEWNVSILERILSENPNALVAIVGDLNSFYQSLPIDTLRNAGLHHIFETLPREERYDYIYQGESQTLDHILITPEFMDLLKDVNILHVNADFPLPKPGDISPERKSDHDPVIAVFSLE